MDAIAHDTDWKGKADWLSMAAKLQASGLNAIDMASDDFCNLAREVNQLKSEKHAVILAHYYVPAATQALADHVGDSFALARLARKLDCETIVLCGVSFMAESVKLLNPARRVLLPEPQASCPMAYMVRREYVERVKSQHPGIQVACYVNSTAEMKSWSDVCVTSSNAVKVIRALPGREALFIPDINLGHYIATQVPEKNIILNKGFCPTHMQIDPGQVIALAEKHEDAVILAHPECTPEVLAEADIVGSTKQIIESIAASDAHEFIVLTVVGVAAEIQRQTQGQNKRLYFPKTTPICPNMAIVTPGKVLRALREGSGEVRMPAPDVAKGAALALERMLELAAR